MVHSERFLAIVDDAKSRIREMTVDEYKAALDAGKAITLVDVREESEWEKAHATQAVHLGKGVIERDVEKAVPESDATLVLYCGGGFRSALAADALQKMGYTDVYSLAGGWRAWNAAEMPTET